MRFSQLLQYFCSISKHQLDLEYNYLYFKAIQQINGYVPNSLSLKRLQPILLTSTHKVRLKNLICQNEIDELNQLAIQHSKSGNK